MNACVRIVALTLVGCYSLSAVAQNTSEKGNTGKRDDLDVTMQIIVDPNAKLPDEVVRRIPLPTARSPATTPGAPAKGPEAKPDAAAKGSERAQEARELGKDAADSARERAREAQQQREEARNSAAEERGRDKDRGPPDAPPGRPDNPRPPRN
jgi:hypothetical protein